MGYEQTKMQGDETGGKAKIESLLTSLEKVNFLFLQKWKIVYIN